MAAVAGAASAHNIGGTDAAFVAATRGADPVPFLYLGAKHMVTGYDHLLFLVGVIFFLFRLRQIALYVSLFSLGHSITLLAGVFFKLHVDPHLVDADVNRSLQEFAEVVKPYWPPERKITDDGYRSLPFPFEEIAALPAFELEMTPTLAEFVGYLRTWSATRRFMVAHRDDPVLVVERRLAGAWPAGERRTLRWPLHLRTGVKR